MLYHLSLSYLPSIIKAFNRYKPESTKWIEHKEEVICEDDYLYVSCLTAITCEDIKLRVIFSVLVCDYINFFK